MKFKAEINIMPREEILDPQGKTVGKNLPKIGIEGVENIRIGKRITLEIEAESEEKAREAIELACKKLLANVIMESYTYNIEEVITAG